MKYIIITLTIFIFYKTSAEESSKTSSSKVYLNDNIANYKKKQKSKKAMPKIIEKSNPMVFVMTYYSLATESGCFATFYASKDFRGERLTIAGNNSLRDIEFDLKPYRLGGYPESVEVGPRAILELYGNENFTDLDYKLKPGEKVSDLKNKPFWDNIESLILKCSKN